MGWIGLLNSRHNSLGLPHPPGQDTLSERHEELQAHKPENKVDPDQLRIHSDWLVSINFFWPTTFSDLPSLSADKKLCRLCWHSPHCSHLIKKSVIFSPNLFHSSSHSRDYRTYLRSHIGCLNKPCFLCSAFCTFIEDYNPPHT